MVRTPSNRVGDHGDLSESAQAEAAGPYQGRLELGRAGRCHWHDRSGSCCVLRMVSVVEVNALSASSKRPEKEAERI